MFGKNIKISQKLLPFREQFGCDCCCQVKHSGRMQGSLLFSLLERINSFILNNSMVAGNSFNKINHCSLSS